jgi:formylglycine-generating enzyme required for sulfatase activity
MSTNLKKAGEFRDTLKCGGKGPEMVWIPSGEFMMGSPEDEVGRRDRETKHKVILTEPFALGKYPVTVGEFRRFADEGGYGWEGSHKDQGGDNHPVVDVSHNDAVAYAAWLSKETGKDYALPTEAQREYACRAGTTTPFSFGDNVTTDQANYNGNYPYGDNPKGENRRKTTAVGRFPANAFGLYDMHGNVWEWVNDWYDETYPGTTTDPTGGGSGSYRVVRGGSWGSDAQNLRSAYRNYNSPGNRFSTLGFRLLLRTNTEDAPRTPDTSPAAEDHVTEVPDGLFESNCHYGVPTVELTGDK